MLDAPRRVAEAGLRIFDRIVPRRCALCARGMEPGRPPVCSLCWHRLPCIPAPRCARCGATRAGVGGAVISRVDSCAECDGWPAALSVAASAYLMAGGAARLVHALKYSGWTRLAEPMGAEIAREVPGLTGCLPVLVPVPLSVARLRERGFNQSLLLARAAAAVGNWPLIELLRRDTGTRRQAVLGRQERLSNVRGLFRLSSGIALPGGLVSGLGSGSAAVVLVDDVLTTGATAAACATAVREAGLRCAGVVTFARAARPLES